MRAWCGTSVPRLIASARHGAPARLPRGSLSLAWDILNIVPYRVIVTLLGVLWWNSRIDDVLTLLACTACVVL